MTEVDGDDGYWIDDQPEQEERCGYDRPHAPHRWFSSDMKYDFNCPGNEGARIEEPDR